MSDKQASVIWFRELGIGDVPIVGGKNASLGEMIRTLRVAGINVPSGFATTADAYWRFIEANSLRDRIFDVLEKHRKGDMSLEKAGAAIRKMVGEGEFPADIATAISSAYDDLSAEAGRDRVDVAVRSSATAEDLPDASFAGQQETFLNITGEKALMEACRRCYASLFTDRAITYRENRGFDHMKVALSIGVQRMVRSDKGCSGVMFSIDTETGFRDAVLINAAWGLGETVVQGAVDPDEYMVFKPLLGKAPKPIIERVRGAKATKMIYASGGDSPVKTVDTTKKEQESLVLADEEILKLAEWAKTIEEHYGKPMDIEWAKDGETGELAVVQARPETVQSRKEAGSLKTYSLRRHGERLVTGHSIGDAITAGKVCRLDSPAEIAKFPKNGILVTEMTDPDWVPIMKRAAAIVTDHGGRTSHAAIVSRELGLPAIVGTGDATKVLMGGQEVTVSCAEGDEGFVYDGIGEFAVEDVSLDDVPETETKVMLNLANPAAALRWWRLPADGVGLARMEFIVNNIVKIHPMALIHPDRVTDKDAQAAIAELTRSFDDKTAYFVETLAYGIARIAASRYPNPVILRTSDFKTNEYADLIGGRGFEPKEENPMLGWRGASRYYSPHYREGFALECQAIRKVRDEIGLTNLVVMIPFCRTVAEADRVLEVMAENGLVRGQNGLEIYVMCEIPANVILAEKFAERFDGFSIGSNDLTQLVLGVDRDSDELADLFDESNEAVTTMIRQVIERAHGAQRKVGLCGQAPSDKPEFAEFLVDAGIDSMSVSPDSFLGVKRHVAQAEARR